MLTLLSEARFWTDRIDLNIKDNDFGAYKFDNKNSSSPKSSCYRDGKADYAKRRGVKWTLDNKRPVKLKNCIRRLEEELKGHRIVFNQWKDNCTFQMMLSNGLLIHICIDIFTGDILRIAFDKYFLGKLVSETIVNVIITRMHIIISYNENQITFVYLQMPSVKRSTPEKISRMDPKIFNIIVGGQQERKLPRYLSCNGSYDLLVIWTKSSQNEVYPWRPTVRDQDRANIHVYKFSRTKLELITYHWTEYDPICIEFSKLNHNQFKSVEQKISKKGDVTIENCTYEINEGIIQRIAVTVIPLQTQVCCHAVSPDYEKLMLGCIDGSVLLFDESRSITHHVKAAFIPTLISWHCDSALIMIANERCQFQCFDISLSCVKNQLISEDMTPTNLLDLSGYFAYQPTLMRMAWNRKPDLAVHTEKYTQNDSFLLLVYEGGPISCLRLFGGSGMSGDVHTSGFTADVLVNKYLSLNQVEKAINILLCLNWDTYGAMCLISLHKIANYIFRHPLTADRETQLQKALGSFHIPVKPLCEETEQEFGDQVRDITRKFFFYLVRYKSYEKAFSLAIDIDDVDLFMDLYNTAKSDGLIDLSVDSFRKAEELLNRLDDCGSDHSTCSRSSCSVCTGSIHHSESEDDEIPTAKATNKPTEISMAKDKEPALAKMNTSTVADIKSMVNPKKSQSLDDLNHPPLPTVNGKPYVPPLPYFTNALNSSPRDKVKISIPKPELKMIGGTSAAPPAIVTGTNKLRVKSQSSLSIWNTSNHPGAGTTSLGYSNPDFDRNPIHSATAYYSTATPVKLLVSTSSVQAATKVNLARIQKTPPTMQHKVVDVIPKPKTTRNVQATVSNNKDREWMTSSTGIPDQTIGIPLTNPGYFTGASSRTVSMSQFSPQRNLIGPPTGVGSSSSQLHHPIGGRNYYAPNSLIPPGFTTNNYNDNSLVPPPIPPPPVIHQYPLISGKIPQINPTPKSSSSSSSSYSHHGDMNKTNFFGQRQTPHNQTATSTNAMLPNLPSTATGSILTKSNPPPSNVTVQGGQPTGVTVNQSTNNSVGGVGKKETGEKNKVKFSDTITVAVVPEIPRKEKHYSINDRLKRSSGFYPMVTDPKRELADSLPLCSPNDEYLKDFTPMTELSTDDSDAGQSSSNTDDTRNTNSIKVVHFGIV